jgi:hypothetical protein
MTCSTHLRKASAPDLEGGMAIMITVIIYWSIAMCCALYFLNSKTQCRWAGGVAQVVGCLPSKCWALNSNPSTTKKKN